MLKDQITELRGKGYSYKQIKAELGCDLSTVSYHIGVGQKQKNVDRTRIRRQNNKDKLVNISGGKCVVCGYNRCVAALEFHHLDPTQKDFEIGRMRTKEVEALMTELEKCVLLCSNCHREVHAGMIELNQWACAGES